MRGMICRSAFSLLGPVLMKLVRSGFYFVRIAEMNAVIPYGVPQTLRNLS